MRRNFLTGIIVLMSISLAGIMAVQYFWISNAISVREQQFDQGVSKVLTKVVDRIEKDRDVYFVTNQVLADDDGSVSYQYEINDSLIWSSNDNTDDGLIYVDGGTGESAISISTGKNHAVLSINAMKNDSVRHKTILKLDSIKDQFDQDQYIILTELEDSIEMMVRKTITQVKQKRVSVNKAIDDMVVELQSFNEPVDDMITVGQLDKRLDQALQDESIQLDYEFGIYNPANDSLTNVHSPGFSAQKGKIYKTRIFPESIFDRPELLMVSFPARRTHILGSMALLLSGSVVFTMIIILTFFLTIRIILKQKKLSDIKSDFINNMTHEFKTPIATISLAVDSINTPSVITNPEKIKYFTQMIGEENKRMN